MQPVHFHSHIEQGNKGVLTGLDKLHKNLALQAVGYGGCQGLVNNVVLFAGHGPDEGEDLILFTNYKQVFLVVLGNIVGFYQALVYKKDPVGGIAGSDYEVAFSESLLNSVKSEKFHQFRRLLQRR